VGLSLGTHNYIIVAKGYQRSGSADIIVGSNSDGDGGTTPPGGGTGTVSTVSFVAFPKDQSQTSYPSRVVF